MMTTVNHWSETTMNQSETFIPDGDIGVLFDMMTDYVENYDNYKLLAEMGLDKAAGEITRHLRELVPSTHLLVRKFFQSTDPAAVRMREYFHLPEHDIAYRGKSRLFNYLLFVVKHTEEDPGRRRLEAARSIANLPYTNARVMAEHHQVQLCDFCGSCALLENNEALGERLMLMGGKWLCLTCFATDADLMLSIVEEHMNNTELPALYPEFWSVFCGYNEQENPDKIQFNEVRPRSQGWAILSNQQFLMKQGFQTLRASTRWADYLYVIGDTGPVMLDPGDRIHVKRMSYVKSFWAEEPRWEVHKRCGNVYSLRYSSRQSESG
jgi:hypothetical protein